MMDIFFEVKLGRVAEGGRSILSSISLRSTVAPHMLYGGGRPSRPQIGFYYPTLPLDELRTTSPLSPTLYSKIVLLAS